MDIVAITVWRAELPLVEGRYSWSKGHSVEAFDTTVVELVTDDGLRGYGECCPLGRTYLPAYAEGVRAGLRVVAPAVLGLDPRNIGAMGIAMDRALLGHPYVKSAIDMASWDLLGQATGLPLHMLLGGSVIDAVPLYRAIAQRPAADMAANVDGYRARGYRRFQLKVGGDADEDIARIRAVGDALRPGETLVADANTGWTPREAARVVNAVRDIDVQIEQPCATYEECLLVRRRTALPFSLDEVLTDVAVLNRIIADGAADAVNLKISRLGGLTKTRQMRDLCIAAGLAITMEDCWGGDIVTAAIAHLAHGIPAHLHMAATDFASYTTRSIAVGTPQRDGGVIRASDAPGLGITPRFDVLGDPVFTVRA